MADKWIPGGDGSWSEKLPGLVNATPTIDSQDRLYGTIPAGVLSTTARLFACSSSCDFSLDVNIDYSYCEGRWYASKSKIKHSSVCSARPNFKSSARCDRELRLYWQLFSKGEEGAVWKWARKDENELVWPTPGAMPSVRSMPFQETAHMVPKLQSVDSVNPDLTHIGKSIVIRGDVSGSGDVYWEGELEGSITLLDGSLTVGTGGRIRANSRAPRIVVQGRVDGNLYGLERTELKKSAIVVGDVHTARIAIEDGAFLEGNARVHQDIPSSQTNKQDAAAPAKFPPGRFQSRF